MSLVHGNFDEVISTLIHNDAYKATKYISENETIKATRRHKWTKRDRQREVVVTFGKPNYAERHFIKLCKDSGEPFPVKKIQLKFS